MNVADTLSQQAVSRPDAPALIEGGRSYTYRELDAAASRAAAALRRQGIAPGDRVGIALRGDALHLAVTYALARMGAVQVGLSRDTPQARHGIARALDLAAVVGESVQPDPAWLESAAPAAPSAPSPGGDAGWAVSLSSGTTGERKAVLHTHAMRIAWQRISLAAIPLRPDERYLAVVGPQFYLGLRVCLDVHAAGGAVILAGALGEAQQFLDLAAAHRATYTLLTPAHVHRLLPLLGGKARLPGLKLRVGTMTVTDALRAAVQRGLTRELYVSYGASDAGANPLLCASPQVLERHPGCLGLPAPGVDAEVVDEAGRVVAAGERGLLRFRTRPMPSGYLLGGGEKYGFRDGWFYPGDIGERGPAGVVHFHGRADDMMNFDGVKVFPAEIEAALLEHPAVAEAAAFAVPHPRRQDLPVAAVVLRTPLEPARLRAWCRGRLGTRSPLHFMVLEALPRNALGKVVRRELLARFEKAAQSKK